MIAEQYPRPSRSRQGDAGRTGAAKARLLIDAQLEAAGWVIQDRDQLDRRASLGVAVREYPMASGPADYLLLLDGKACGTVDLLGIGIEGVEDDEGFKLQSLGVTNFGEVLLDQLAGEWSTKIRQRERERAPDPIDLEAEKIIEQLSEEQREAIRRQHGDDRWTQEPFFSAFEKLGLAGSEDGPLPDTTKYHFTNLGRAVLLALKYGKWRTDGKEPWGRYGDGKGSLDGDDQKA